MNREERRAWRRYVLGCQQMTHGERLVLLALETFTDYRDGTNAHPGVAVLAQICNVSDRLVKQALDHGRQLGLIAQTARANPKAHKSATYKLLSTCSSVHVETDSECSSVHVETDFNVQNSDFNVQKDGVSKCTSVHTTYPLTPSQLTPESDARASSAAQLPAVPDSHPPPVNGNQANNNDHIVIDAEPPKHCRAHMPFGTSEPCGGCKIARLNHDDWNDRRVSARVCQLLDDQQKRQEAEERKRFERRFGRTS